MHKAMKALTLALSTFGNPDGLGAPTPGGAADGVVVAASAPHERIERAGISSGLEALAALHRKGALTDSEFAAAKAKLLG